MLGWNYMRPTNPRTLNHVRNLMGNFNPSVVCLVETKTDENWSLHFYNRFSKQWEWAAIPTF